MRDKMIKPPVLKKGDKIAIVSLSDGLLGMPFCRHEEKIAIKRLKEFGLKPVIMPNAKKDIEYLKNHPEKRAQDLKQAFMDESIKAIITSTLSLYRSTSFLIFSLYSSVISLVSGSLNRFTKSLFSVGILTLVKLV